MQEEKNSLLEQILSDPHFHEWAAGHAPDLNLYWYNWAQSSPEHETALQKAREITDELQSGQPVMSDEYIRMQVDRAITLAKQKEHTVREQPIISFFRSYRFLAASVVVLLVSGWIVSGYYYSEHKKNSRETITDQQIRNQLTVINDHKTPRHIQLPDGSSVILQYKSELSYPDQFPAGHREVFLKGDAFFEVTKNPESPFVVHTGTIKTQVLGTSFRIKTDLENSRVVVSVKSGKVAVFNDTLLPGQTDVLPQTILMPNERAVFGNTSHHQLPETIEPESRTTVIPIERMTFSYETTPVTEVLQDLESAYGVDISYNSEALQNCSITAQLEDEPLAQKLKWICTILEATYTIENHQIIFHSKSCNP